MFGRESERASIECFLDKVRSGFTTLVLDGAPGIGKTTLWRAGVELAAARSYTVLTCRPAQSEAAISMVGIADLLAQVAGDVLAGLPGPQRSALDVALLRNHAPEPRDPRALSTAVRTALAELANRAPLLLAIDDLHWLDAPSARVLEFAARRLGTARIGLLATRRAGHPRADRVHIRNLVPPDRVTRVGVGPLSPLAIRDVLRAAFDRLPRHVRDRIADVVGGNPLFALEIARALLDRGLPAAGQPLPVPDDVEQLVSHRARALPIRTREALLTVAALPQARLALIEAAWGRPARPDLSPAEQAGIVELDREVARFTQPLFATAVYSSATAEHRRRVHRRLAQVVDDAEQRARHLALAADGPDEAVAAALEAAARGAAGRGAAITAADLAEQSRALTPARADTAARERGMLAARCHITGGDPARAQVLLEEIIASTGPGPARAAALVLLGQLRYVRDGVPAARAVFAQALADARGDPALIGVIEGQLGHCMAAAGDLPAAAGHASRALGLLERHAGPPPALAHALALSATIDVALGREVDEQRLDRALGLAGGQRVAVAAFRPGLLAALCLLYSGRIEQASARLRELRQQILDRGHDCDLPAPVAYLAWTECLRGDLAAAAGYAREAYETAATVGSRPMCGFATAVGALVDAYGGDEQASRPALARAMALLRSTGRVADQPWVLGARAVLELSLGDAAAASAALRPLTDRIEAGGTVGMPLCLLLPDQIEALIALGDLARAQRLLVPLENLARGQQLPWLLALAARCQALLAAAGGGQDAALAALDEAFAWHAKVDLPLEEARTLLVAGMVRRRMRHKRDAQALLERALAEFDHRGAVLWARRTRAEMDRIGLRPKAPAQLTPSERRVAELVSAGLTNREVALAAFMSPKTVEANLSRVYRKLGIRSRVELGVRLAAGNAS